MAQFVAFAPDVQVTGETILSIVKGVGIRSWALQVLEKHGVTDLKEGQWYSQKAFLDAFKDLAQKAGSTTLRNIGTSIPKTALWPPEIDTLEKALASIDVAYHMNHRGGEIGHYEFSVTGPRLGKLVGHNPYPCEFDWGIVESTTTRFAPMGSVPVVTHDDAQPCRKNGADSCTYLITW